MIQKETSSASSNAYELRKNHKHTFPSLSLCQKRDANLVWQIQFLVGSRVDACCVDCDGRARAISCLYYILQGVQHAVSLFFSVPYLFAISCVVYDLQLSLSCLWAQFILLKTLDSVLTSIKNARAFAKLPPIRTRPFAKSPTPRDPSNKREENLRAIHSTATRTDRTHLPKSKPHQKKKTKVD